ncbi:MAG: hypothetical protein KAJ19_12645 [Gammaproteobacteria bacterium]|nr:hypothetical protein [Gammaproteobacteria bacterium]
MNKRVKADEHSRQMREWDRRIKAIFGTEGTPDDVERGRAPGGTSD